jgi:uncharacterized protein (TIGR00255 family)
MIKSMTGFGRGEHSDGKRNMICEIRAVNHRYSDIAVKMPRKYSFSEERIKRVVKETVRRGKVEVSLQVENLTENDNNIRLNTMVARQYYENLVQLKEELGLKESPTLSLMASLPDVMKVVADVEDEEELTSQILIPVKLACEKLDEMRRQEGEKLAEDLMMRGQTIRELAREIDEMAPKVVKEYVEKMKERIKELLGNEGNISEERILTEAAIFADKSNITEELVRLDSHMIQLVRIIGETGDPDGKRLDFLVQEMNREANTIGSKANHIDITNKMLMIKSEIEKIREQVQNVE